MPLYDFRCNRCSKTFEMFQKIADPSPVSPCCSTQSERLIGRAAVHIFHEGFYEHLAEDPIYFKKKSDLRHYCRAAGLSMDYVE